VPPQIDAGELQLLYVAPERVLQEETLAFLWPPAGRADRHRRGALRVAWGHDFRQDYLALDQLRRAFPGVPRMALTATADPRTRDDIAQRLALDDPRASSSGFDRPNIRYGWKPKPTPRAQLQKFLAARRGEAGIVYCLSRKSVEQTAAWLAAQGFDALPYHAGLPADVRAAQPGALPARRCRDHGGHHRVRHGHRQAGRALRRAPRPAEEHRGLLPGDRPRRSRRRTAGRGVDDLRPAGRGAAVADDGQSQADERHKRIEQDKLHALLGWCEITRCRRAALLGYFGETHPGDCGNCDICLDPPHTWDGTEAAQKLLSCVYRTGQRFGAGHVIDVLRGATRTRSASTGTSS
jgi:ATP-dependent DNA helicase RecQ